MKNNLPKYWAVKRDENNPDWQKVIDYINETYNKNWKGGSWDFYGYGGSDLCNGANALNDIECFENNPILLTIQEFLECIEEEEFIHGERVGVSDKSEEKALEDLKISSYKYYYIGKSIDGGKYICENNNGILHYWKYIAKIPKEEIKEKTTYLEIFKKLEESLEELKKYFNI